MPPALLTQGVSGVEAWQATYFYYVLSLTRYLLGLAVELLTLLKYPPLTWGASGVEVWQATYCCYCFMPAFHLLGLVIFIPLTLSYFYSRPFVVLSIATPMPTSS